MRGPGREKDHTAVVAPVVDGTTPGAGPPAPATRREPTSRPDAEDQSAPPGPSLLGQLLWLFVMGGTIFPPLAFSTLCGLGENSPPPTTGLCHDRLHTTVLGLGPGGLTLVGAFAMAVVGCVGSQRTQRWWPAIAGFGVGGLVEIVVWSLLNSPAG